MVKYADDTYLVVPSVNGSTRQQEMDNIATWAAANNLKLNVSKSKEIIFHNSRRRITETLPQLLPDISRQNVLKILGVTITNHLSASEHIRRIVSDSAQSLYALRMLRHHGMTEIGLQSTCRLPSGRRFAADVCITRVERVYHSDGPPTRRRISQLQQAMRLLPT